MVFVRECRGRQKEERSKGDGYVPGHGVDVREPKPNDGVSAVANERWRTRGRRDECEVKLRDCKTGQRQESKRRC